MSQIIKIDNISVDLQQLLSDAQYDKLFVLTDENTCNLCLPLISGIREIENASQIVIPPTDKNKNIETLSYIWCELTRHGATRHTLLVNLGGGMVTDIGGFAAATFKRGIKYINIPTTLLGAVDAAVGGKTAINFEGLKNEIGAFYPALKVLISSRFFTTLSRGEILSGFAEMLKHELIHSDEEWEELLTFDIENIDYDWLNNAVFRSVSIKESVVEKDPMEQNIRKALNLGHTVGHAFESFAAEQRKPVAHGYAVAWGLIAELYLSHRICGFPKEKLQKMVRFIRQNYGSLPIGCNDYARLFDIMTHDKKNVGNSINFALLSEIGNVCINQQLEKEMIFESLDFYRDCVGV